MHGAKGGELKPLNGLTIIASIILGERDQPLTNLPVVHVAKEGESNVGSFS